MTTSDSSHKHEETLLRQERLHRKSMSISRERLATDKAKRLHWATSNHRENEHDEAERLPRESGYERKWRQGSGFTEQPQNHRERAP